MGKIGYKISGGLSDEQIGQMHENAIFLTEKIGLKIEHKGILEILRNQPGVKVKGSKVHFQGDLVERCIKELEYPDNVNMPDYTIATGSYALNILDMDSREIRKPTLDDLVQMTKLADSMDMVGTSPVRPLDLGNDELSEVAMYKVVYEHSRFLNTGIYDQSPKSTLRVANYAYEMAQVAGKEVAIDCWIISPFKTNTDQLEIIYNFIDRKVPMLVNTMPVRGTTSPIFLIGSYIQSMAELFAGLTLLRLINPDGKVYTSIFDSIRSYPFDMRYGTFVYGSPDDILATMLQIQLNQRYGLPIMAKSLLTTASQPDSQAACEKMGHTMIAALAGVRAFTTAGLLSVDELFSGEQLIIDYEIVDYIKHVIQGFEFGESEFGIEAILEAGTEGTFLTHESTLTNYREAFWVPRLFEHRMLNSWINDGKKSIRERAREFAKKKISEHSFRVSSNIRNELDRIYKSAKKEMLG